MTTASNTTGVTAIGIMIFLLVLMDSVAFADSIDDAEAKKRGVPVQQIQLERTTAQINDLQLKLTAAVAENAVLKKQIEQLNAKITEQAKQLALVMPSNDLPADGVVEVTAAMLETMGEKYANKTVKMIGLKFSETDNDNLDVLPGITIASNGIVSRVDVRQMEKWIGFDANDSNGKFFQRFYASKKDEGLWRSDRRPKKWAEVERQRGRCSLEPSRLVPPRLHKN